MKIPFTTTVIPSFEEVNADEETRVMLHEQPESSPIQAHIRKNQLDAVAHDEVLRNFAIEYRATIEKIKTCGGASDDILKHPHLLAKMALVITVEKFSPMDTQYRSDMKNLRHFI